MLPEGSGDTIYSIRYKFLRRYRISAFAIVDPSDKHKQDQTAYIPIDYVECFVEHGE